MSRFARVVIPGCPHHVTQRGNRRQVVFNKESEFEFYLELIDRFLNRYHVETTGYSLMPNHIHNVAIPLTPTSLAEGFGRLHNEFSRWQNVQYNRTGHLWQNRFYSCPMSEEHFWRALRYVELNPVRAGLVAHAWDWPWSSARAHVTGVDDTGLLKMDRWAARFDGKSWRAFLEEGMGRSEEQDEIRLATRTGRPLGNEGFILELESLTGRRLRLRKPGRKPKHRS